MVVNTGLLHSLLEMATNQQNGKESRLPMPLDHAAVAKTTEKNQSFLGKDHGRKGKQMRVGDR